jgi:hypothetical protein
VNAEGKPPSQNKNTTNTFMACLRKIPEYIGAGCVAVVNFFGSLFVGIATLLKSFFNKSSSTTFTDKAAPKAPAPSMGTITHVEKKPEPNAIEQEIKTALDFLQKNQKEADEIIKNYCIPLPRGVENSQGLQDFFSENKEDITAKDALIYISRVHNLENHLSKIKYSKDDTNIVVPENVLFDYARALGKPIIVKKKGDNDSFNYTKYREGRRSYSFSISQEKYAQLVSDLNISIVEIDMDEWEKSANKIHYLAQKFFSSEELSPSYPNSYGDLLKKAIQKGCTTKRDQEDEDWIIEICGRTMDGLGAYAIMAHRERKYIL